jgi:D-alanyl-D-alanine carboxypeptidase
MLVITPQGRFFEAAGYDSVENKTVLQPTSRFGIGSNTKTFTAVLVLQLVEEGKISLDDLSQTYLPEQMARVPNGDRVTVEMLLNHTSGIKDYANTLMGELVEKGQVGRGFTPDEMFEEYVKIAGGQADFEPGQMDGTEQMWLYSNTNYLLLGMLLEKVTGKELGALYKERIFDPLGLKNTDFPTDAPPAGSVPAGYERYPDGRNTTGWNPSQGWAAGAIFSTAEDLATYSQALQAGKLFKKPETLQLMRDMVIGKYVATLGVKGYGLGLIEFLPGVWGHEGQTVNFESLMMTIPEKNATVIVWGNTAYASVDAFRYVVGWLSD